MPDEFFEGLKTVAGHPLALVGYVCLLAAWVFTVFRRSKLHSIEKLIKDLPEAERAEVLKHELSVLPREGITAQEWLEDRKRNQLFVAFIATLVVVLLIVALALYRGAQPSIPEVDPEMPAAELDLVVSPDRITGIGVVDATIRATVSNRGNTVAELPTLQLETPEGVEIDDFFSESTVTLEPLPGQIASTVEWDVAVDTSRVSELLVRLGARNSAPQVVAIPVEGVSQTEFKTHKLPYRASKLGRLPGADIAVLSPSRREIVILSIEGVEQRAFPLADYCSEPGDFVVDAQRGVYWVACQGSSNVVATSIEEGTVLSIPPFPNRFNSSGTPLSRIPYSIAGGPTFVAFTSTEGEQCLWVYRWPKRLARGPDRWMFFEYPDDLTWTDCRLILLESSRTLVMIHDNVIPASLTIFDPDANGDERFVTLSGHEYEYIGGITDVVDHPDEGLFFADEHGENLSILATDGSRYARTPLTAEEDWHGEKRKWTILELSEDRSKVCAAVNVTDELGDIAHSSVFTANVLSLDSVELRVHWPMCEVLDMTIARDNVVLLCRATNAHSNDRVELRVFSL